MGVWVWVHKAEYEGVAAGIQHSVAELLCDGPFAFDRATLPEAFNGDTGAPLPHSDSVIGVSALALFVLPHGK